MKLDQLKDNWEGLGESDPFWAVLTNPEKINNKWDKAEFFASGQSWVNHIFASLNLNNKVNFESALDFGCGPGRLTQALCQKFEHTTGADISSSMIKSALELNAFPKSCQYFVNDTNDLSQFPSEHFDFVLSFITLQHISPVYIIKYLEEFKRVTKNGGYILFNLPTKPPFVLNILLNTIGSKGVNLIRKIYYRKKHVIEMHWIAENKMLDFFKNNNLEVVQITKDLGPGTEWNSNLYLLKKN